MSEFKGTPGPWEATGGYTPTVRKGETLLCVPGSVADELGGRRLEELHANARLIAAAPDLLAAAEELRAAFLDGCGEATKGPKRERLVRAGDGLDKAIAKAKGA